MPSLLTMAASRERSGSFQVLMRKISPTPNLYYSELSRAAVVEGVQNAKIKTVIDKIVIIKYFCGF